MIQRRLALIGLAACAITVRPARSDSPTDPDYCRAIAECHTTLAHTADPDLADTDYGASLSSMADRHLVTIEVAGRPATFATAHEGPWKEAVRAAIAATGVEPLNARFAVRIVFRLAIARSANEVWDLDNLVKPTLDAMEGIFGLRAFRGTPQPADDRVDRLAATKRLPRGGETPGATIDVWTIDPG